MRKTISPSCLHTHTVIHPEVGCTEDIRHAYGFRSQSQHYLYVFLGMHCPSQAQSEAMIALHNNHSSSTHT